MHTRDKIYLYYKQMHNVDLPETSEKRIGREVTTRINSSMTYQFDINFLV